MFLLIFYYFSCHFSITIEHNPRGPSTRLNIKSLQVQDEDTYLCETTFLEPLESCSSSGTYSIDLKVLGELQNLKLKNVKILLLNYSNKLYL